MMQNTNISGGGPTGNPSDNVERARVRWVNSLIDVSRRNNLLYYRDLKRGTLDLGGVKTEHLTALLSGAKVRLVDLMPSGDPGEIGANALQIQRRAQENLEERGLQTLFLAYGMASWPAPQGAKTAPVGRPYDAAVVLLPASIEIRVRDPRSAAVQIVGEPQINLALLHVLETDHGCVIDPETLLMSMADGDDALNPEPILNHLREAARSVSEFRVTDRLVLGNFSFQKMAMVADLQRNSQLFASHDVLAAMAGNAAARQRVMGRRAEIDPHKLDAVPADNEFLVLDADSSQQRVIHSVLKLQSGVIQGPPGTGKSQTIVNLIAALVASGQRVLFVAEKRAALEVVLHRLRRIGLGHLALDLHDAGTTRSSVMGRIGQSLEVIGQVLPVDTADLHAQFEERRARLIARVEKVHRKRMPAERSVYELQGELLRARPEVRIELRWRGADLDRLTKERVAIICDLLREAAGLAPIFSASAAPLWARATLADGRAAQQAADLVSRIAGQRLPELQAALVELAEDIRLPVPDDLRELATFFAYLTQLEKLLTRYSPQLFAQDLGQLVKDLSSAGNPITHAISSAFNSRYRRALECARRLQRAGGEPLRPKQILHDTAMALGLCEVWRKNVAGDTPIPDALPDFHRAQGSSEALRADLQAVTPFLAKVIADWETRKFPGLLRVFGELHADVQTPHQLPRANEIQREIERLGSAAFISHMASKDTHPQAWPDQFRHAWLASCLDAVLAQDASLSGFVGATHNRFVDEFVKLDRGRIALAADRLRRAHAKHAVEVRNQQPEQDSLVQRELQKKRRHIPLRTLLAQAPDVLTAICPCWMASPLSVSQLFATGQRYFDVVLFDEASQVPPEDAAPAIMRATHVVVAGDRHQLPPTKFFASEDSGPEEDEDEPLATAGFESLLDLMSAFTGQWSLDWHYRSRDESLIAFSNRHIYSDRLITFPSTGGALALSHVLVSPNGNDARQADMTRSNPDEAKKVVEMVIEQARSRPQESLGVIALGIKHAQRIQAELDRVLPACPDLEEFFSQGRDEPFFVKNLERVQGDERDAILLSVGYGKDADGKLPYRFGPLLQDGGERRLNVAVTRARSHLALVSSFSHLDMDPNRSRSRGVELLRLYLEYAASQGRGLADAHKAGAALNAFEADVYDALTAKGIPLVPQWGVSGYRIDFVAQHPDKPGAFVLAIECDGASYHSTPTARDRDRLRQQQLEALGWTFHRIWSTDWYFRREEEIGRAVGAYERAVKRYEERGAQVAAVEPAALVASNSPAPANVSLQSRLPQRGPRPSVNKRSKIDEYSDEELVMLVKWIKSDGLERIDDEIMREMLAELGFQKLGSRIKEAIRQAINATRDERGAKGGHT